MTRKHFIAIAAYFAAEYAIAPEGAARLHIRALALSMSDMFYRENPRFNRDQFLTACGFSGRV